MEILKMHYQMLKEHYYTRCNKEMSLRCNPCILQMYEELSRHHIMTSTDNVR